MSIELNVDIKGFDRAMKRAPIEVNKALRRKLSRTIGPRFKRRVKKITRVDTGELRASVFQRLMRRIAGITIGYRAAHARYIERKDNVLGKVGDEEKSYIEAQLDKAVQQAAKRIEKVA